MAPERRGQSIIKLRPLHADDQSQLTGSRRIRYGEAHSLQCSIDQSGVRPATRSLRLAGLELDSRQHFAVAAIRFAQTAERARQLDAEPGEVFIVGVAACDPIQLSAKSRQG